MTGNADDVMSISTEASLPPSLAVWGILGAELLPQSEKFSSEIKREIELFKICFNITMEKILPEEKSIKTTIYSICNTTKLWELLL